MSNDFEFVEDKTFLTALPEEKIPEKSIEGWFYKKFPGSIAIKRLILLLLVVVLFAASAFFFLLSRPDPVDTVRSVGFINNIYIL